MKRALLPLAFAAAMCASTAHAAIGITATPAVNPYGGPTPTYNFEADTAAITGGSRVFGDITGQHVEPLGSNSWYYSVGPTDGSPATLTLAGGLVESISLLWGTVDDYNTLELFDSLDNLLGTVTGSQVISGGTFGSSSRLVTLALTGDTQSVAKLKFTSTSNAFEFDNVAVTAAVPEPTTWMMLILGMLGVGFAMRRKSSDDSVRIRYA